MLISIRLSKSIKLIDPQTLLSEVQQQNKKQQPQQSIPEELLMIMLTFPQTSTTPTKL